MDEEQNVGHVDDAVGPLVMHIHPFIRRGAGVVRERLQTGHQVVHAQVALGCHPLALDERPDAVTPVLYSGPGTGVDFKRLGDADLVVRPDLKGRLRTDRAVVNVNDRLIPDADYRRRAERVVAVDGPVVAVVADPLDHPDGVGEVGVRGHLDPKRHRLTRVLRIERQIPVLRRIIRRGRRGRRLDSRRNHGREVAVQIIDPRIKRRERILITLTITRLG